MDSPAPSPALTPVPSSSPLNAGGGSVRQELTNVTLELELEHPASREPQQDLLQQLANAGSELPADEPLKRALVAKNEVLIGKICSKIEQLSDSDRLRPQYIILFSDILCPILKYHAELFAEIVRVIPDIIDAGAAKASIESVPTDTNGNVSGNSALDLQLRSNILALLISPNSDKHVEAMLAEPFKLDLFDRMRMVDIQVENTPLPLKSVFVADDSWASLQAMTMDKSSVKWHGTEGAGVHCAQSLRHQSRRLESLLSSISDASKLRTGPMELICVIDQSEAELYGVPMGLGGKVIFIVTKDREERPKAVALKTCMHWIDRIFLRADYSLEWIHANVIPLYLELPGAPGVNLSGQRTDSTFAGVGIHVSAKRPLEAYVRVRVRQGEGAKVLEPSVLEEIERTKIFEMQAIRKPMFVDLMENMSLSSSDAILGGWKTKRKDEDEQDSAESTEDENPFL
ncbi:hypothetical protein EDD21DRAFT_354145 [Dissophora ornata]|nr:hypothetical protein BGZ58_005463 [Dissophora ornata]KAI8600904.1 hypothetical protein EDD21DRAFT_354145 [Dissophora ornata]